MIKLSDITRQHFNERDVEVPALMSFIKGTASNTHISSILDVGAHYSYATYAPDVRNLLVSQQYTACDILDDPNTASIVDEYLIGNVAELSVPIHDLVTCISVIEHCGITTYKKDDIELEQYSIFDRLTSLAKKALFLTFPYGAPGVFPDQYSNIHEEMLSNFCTKWRNEKGSNANIELQFFYNEFSPQGKPWSELSKEDASKIPLRVDLGLVQCVCIFGARC